MAANYVNSRNMGENYFGKKIRCKKTGKIFETIRSAASYFKVNPSTIAKYASHRNKKQKLDIEIEYIN